MVSFAPEVITHLGIFPITNTFLDTLLVDIILVTGSILLIKRFTFVPVRLIQNALEAIIEMFYALAESIADKRASQIFPYLMSFFLFILIANWSSLIPGVSSIGFFHNREFIPLFRGATTDLNTTLALALVSAVSTHMLSIKIIGIKEYLSRYFSFNPLNLFVGLLEIFSEITKIISLSFRLFGNIFAGEVVLLTVSSIFAILLPLPFLLLEILVGVVQALVFSMLTMAFMAILTTPHQEANAI